MDATTSGPLPRRPSSGSLNGCPLPPPPAPHPSVHTVPLQLPYALNGQPPGRLETLDGHFSMIFRRKYERLDWRKLAALDLEKVYKSQDVKSLQENLTQLAFFDLEEELRSVEIHPQFVKLFQTMQLSLEYLLYVQDRLQRDLSSTAGQLQEKDDAVTSLSDEVCRLRQAVDIGRDELKRRRKLMIAQQDIINSAAKGSYHKCPLCEKAFIERKYLETHFCRRHPGEDMASFSKTQGTTTCRPEDQGALMEKLQMLLNDIQRYSDCRKTDGPPDARTSGTDQLQRQQVERRSSAKTVRSSAATVRVSDVARDTVARLSAEQSVFALPSGVAHLVTRESMQSVSAEENSADSAAGDVCMFDADTETSPEPVPRQSLDKLDPRTQNILTLYDKQQTEVQHLRQSLHALQCQYGQSEKALTQLQSHWQNLLDRDQSKSTEQDNLQRKVGDVEKMLHSSEEVWKVRLNEINDTHQRSLTELERSLQKKADDDQKGHTAEKMKLQMVNEEQEKRIKELERRIQQLGEKPPPGAMHIQQIKVHNRSVRPTPGGKNLTPRLSSAMEEHPQMLTDIKSELERALDSKLAEYGIQKGTTAVSDRERDAIFGRLRDEHSQLQGKLAKYGAARSTIENHIRDRPPTEYSSTELLDEASKIRIRTRTGRQVINDDKSQKITEITTYNITPIRSTAEPPSTDANRSSEVTPKSVAKKVHFDDHPQACLPLGPLDSFSDRSAEDDDHAIIPSELSKPVAAGKPDDEAWFTDED